MSEESLGNDHQCQLRRPLEWGFSTRILFTIQIIRIPAPEPDGSSAGWGLLKGSWVICLESVRNSLIWKFHRF